MNELEIPEFSESDFSIYNPDGQLRVQRFIGGGAEASPGDAGGYHVPVRASKKERVVLATVNVQMRPYGGLSLPRDGFVEERRFRELLESSGKLDVQYDEVLDRDFAVDAVVTVRDAPWLNPVGIQFTLSWGYTKKRRALNRFQRTRVVPRFLYLRSKAPLIREALDPLIELILDCAKSDEVHGITTAALRLDTSGCHVVEAIHHYPLTRQHRD